jgi:hypothetical protein
MEAFLLNPLLGLAIAIVLTVIGAKLTVGSSDLLLVLAWIFFAVSVYRTPPISHQVFIQRMLLVALLSCLAGLGLRWLSGWRAPVPDRPAVSLRPEGEFQLTGGGFSGTVPLWVTNPGSEPVFSVQIVIATNHPTRPIWEQLTMRLDDDPTIIVTDSSGVGVKVGNVLFIEPKSPNGELTILLDELVPGQPRRIWLTGKGPPMLTATARVVSASTRPAATVRRSNGS